MKLTTSKFDWYKQYRTRGCNPAVATVNARYHSAAVTEAYATLDKLSWSSRRRMTDFYEEFVRSEYVSIWTSERDSDFINEPERAARVADAPEGHYAVTHAEIIEDERDAFSAWLRDRKSCGYADRFEAAVQAHFTLVEMWHEYNGSLDEEQGG